MSTTTTPNLGEALAAYIQATRSADALVVQAFDDLAPILRVAYTQTNGNLAELKAQIPSGLKFTAMNSKGQPAEYSARAALPFLMAIALRMREVPDLPMPQVLAMTRQFQADGGTIGEFREAMAKPTAQGIIDALTGIAHRAYKAKRVAKAESIDPDAFSGLFRLLKSIDQLDEKTVSFFATESHRTTYNAVVSAIKGALTGLLAEDALDRVGELAAENRQAYKISIAAEQD